jgi:tRNA-dihydrouridine synthase A
MSLFSPLSIAPMIDWTDTHFRLFMRLLAPEALLYTEMKTTQAIYYKPKQSLCFHQAESPVALQLGGASPTALALAARQAEDAGFSEVNLNLGCPSDRVLAGNFGASMMREPELVAECLCAMKAAVSIPVTAKTRIGIDNEDSYDFFESFVEILIQAGCDKLIVHARKAWLHGLNPKQNRTIPPLHYDYVHRIRASLPKHVPVILNGHIEAIESVQTHLKTVDGVMIGRLACRDPYAIAGIHHALYPTIPKPSRSTVFQDYMAYAIAQFEQGESLHRLLKPVLNLVHGLSGARAWKQALLQMKSIQNNAALQDLIQDLTCMEQSSNGFSNQSLVN